MVADILAPNRHQAMSNHHVVEVRFISDRVRQWFRNRKHFVNTRNAYDIKTLLHSVGGHKGSRKARRAGNQIMLTGLWIYCHMCHIVWHGYAIAGIKHIQHHIRPERLEGRESVDPFVIGGFDIVLKFIYIYMGQVTKLWLSCYLVSLSIDSKTR